MAGALHPYFSLQHRYEIMKSKKHMDGSNSEVTGDFLSQKCLGNIQEEPEASATA
jgi:hypothetical protein